MGEFAAFLILSILILGSATIVVTSRNIVRAALSLVPTFLGVTGFYVMLHAEFVAGIQVLIYAGAITVLILFVIMLTEGGSGTMVRQVTAQVPLGAMAATWMAFLLLVGLSRAAFPVTAGQPPQYSVQSIGTAFLTDYVLIFEVTSLVLLISLIGAIVIARREE